MRYVFGDCSLDTASREFRRGRDVVHVSPKAFDLLSLLIEERPRVLSKADLMAALWPDTFVVEGNLPVIIGELRTALGDRSANSVIRTHHGIGYSFTAPVVEAPSSHEPAAPGLEAFLKIGGRMIALSPGENVVGRDANSEIYINDSSVSRTHARLMIGTVDATLIDAGSKNGTHLNGAPVVQPMVLRDGDELTFGNVRARFFLSRERDAASTMTL